MGGLSDGDVARLSGVVERPEIPGGRYQVLERVGRGGMGTVFRARDLALDREVAIKVVHPTREAGRGPATAHGDLAARLEREARTIARLDHASVVPIHEIGALDDGSSYYVMKYVAGTTLRERRRSSAPSREALRTFLRLCEAMAHAHALGFVHRDLKPDNVMVGPHGELYVMDWGVAKVLGEPEPAASPDAAARPGTAHGVVLGTKGYMAPEQERGASAQVGCAADVFALGGILAFLWTGRDPETGPAGLPGAARPLRAIAARCRAEAPADRYPSAQVLAADIARHLDGEPVSAYREGPIERLGRFLDRNRFVAWLVVGYLTLRVLVFFFTGR